MKHRLADRIAKAMIETAHGDRIMWGDGLLVAVARGRIKGRLGKHPLGLMTAAMNALDRAPDLFKKLYTRGHDSNAKSRRVRLFRLIGTPRPIGKIQHT